MNALASLGWLSLTCDHLRTKFLHLQLQLSFPSLLPIPGFAFATYLAIDS